jgi:hypothetical protein
MQGVCRVSCCICRWAFAILVVLGTVIISYGEWSLSGQVKPRPAKSEFELRDVTGKSGSCSLLPLKS